MQQAHIIPTAVSTSSNAATPMATATATAAQPQAPQPQPLNREIMMEDARRLAVGDKLKIKWAYACDDDAREEDDGNGTGDGQLQQRPDHQKRNMIPTEFFIWNGIVAVAMSKDDRTSSDRNRKRNRRSTADQRNKHCLIRYDEGGDDILYDFPPDDDISIFAYKVVSAEEGEMESRRQKRQQQQEDADKPAAENGDGGEDKASSSSTANKNSKGDVADPTVAVPGAQTDKGRGEGPRPPSSASSTTQPILNQQQHRSHHARLLKPPAAIIASQRKDDNASMFVEGGKRQPIQQHAMLAGEAPKKETGQEEQQHSFQKNSLATLDEDSSFSSSSVKERLDKGNQQRHESRPVTHRQIPPDAQTILSQMKDVGGSSTSSHHQQKQQQHRWPALATPRDPVDVLHAVHYYRRQDEDSDDDDREAADEEFSDDGRRRARGGSREDGEEDAHSARGGGGGIDLTINSGNYHRALEMGRQWRLPPWKGGEQPSHRHKKKTKNYDENSDDDVDSSVPRSELSGRRNQHPSHPVTHHSSTVSLTGLGELWPAPLLWMSYPSPSSSTTAAAPAPTPAPNTDHHSTATNNGRTVCMPREDPTYPYVLDLSSAQEESLYAGLLP